MSSSSDSNYRRQHGSREYLDKVTNPETQGGRMSHSGHQIVKPTPRRPTAGARITESSSNMKDVTEANSGKEIRENVALEKTTPPSRAKYYEVCKNDLGQILPERDTSSGTVPFNSSQKSDRYFHQIVEPERTPGFITNVLISNETTDNEDDGYEILSSRDEAAERGSLFSSNNISDIKMESLSPGKNLRSVGKDENHSHLHMKSRKIAGRADIERLKKDIGALKLSKELKADQPDNESPESSWSENTDIDVNDLDQVADGSGHLKRYTRKGNQQRATSSAPRSKRRGMTFISNPQGQNSDRSTFMSSEARGMNNASQETLSTTATLAEEFVWVDSHSRLVELQQLPWIHLDLMKVLRRTIEQDTSLMSESVSDMIAIDILPRLSYYLQRTLVRLAREAQRLSKSIGVCGKENVLTALKVVLSPSLAISAVKGCLRSAAMFAMSGETTGQSKSSRGALILSVGRMHEWMCLVKIGTYVTEYAAIYLTSTIEAVLEEIVVLCKENMEKCANKSPLCARASTAASSKNTKNKLNYSESPLFNADLLEKVVATSGEVWAIFQPYAHLNSSRTSNGSLSLSKCVEVIVPTFYDSFEAGIGCYVHHPTSSNIEKHQKTNVTNERNIRQILLTTCIGSTEELEDMALTASALFQQVWSEVPVRSNHFKGKLSQYYGACALSADDSLNIVWSSEAIQSLFHFMRCSQLEYGHGVEGLPPIQELVYERPYMVLPPIMEWVRVTSCFAEHRNSCIVDDNDVLQAARVLLPGMDCPPRSLCHSAVSWPSKTRDEQQCLGDPKKNMAFHMMMSGCRDLIDFAKNIVGSSEVDGITNGSGSTEMTALQVAALRGDLHLMKSLLDLAFVNIDGTTASSAMGGKGIGDLTTKNWTPLTYAAIAGHTKCVKYLLERGARVNGSATESVAAETPLHVAAAAGNIRTVELLMAYGASPFSAASRDDTSIMTTITGTLSAVAIAACHGHRRLLHMMVTQFLQMEAKAASMLKSGKRTSATEEEVLSLEEILAEGMAVKIPSSNTQIRTESWHHGSDDVKPSARKIDRNKSPATSLGQEFNKSQIKKVQEAMYHAAETGNIELALDMRNLGVPWTLYTWLQTLHIANEKDNNGAGGTSNIVNELLQDFSVHWLEEQSNLFADVAVDLLFTIFTHKNEGTMLLLADIFSLCYSVANGGPTRARLREDKSSLLIDGGRGSMSPLDSEYHKIELHVPPSPLLAKLSPPINSVRSYDEENIEDGSHVNDRTSRIDLKFINSPELSDVRFRVEGRIFYAHKIVLLTASSRFKSMLNYRLSSSANGNGEPPVLQINDIRYDVFALVMNYLYNGSASCLKIENSDLLELMAAANFFQLPGLLYFCETTSARLVDLDNVVSYYIHAKVYNALRLLEFCEFFILENMVALLSYNDSAVKRLLMGKKMQGNHDVLAGLKNTLKKQLSPNSFP